MPGTIIGMLYAMWIIRLLFNVFLILMATGCGPMTFVVGVSPGDQRLVSTVVQTDGRWFNDRIAIVDVSGMIYNGNRPGLIQQGENPVSLLHEQLSAAANDEKIKAVILRLNTPGGTVTASDMMYQMVQQFKAQTGKPVLALMMDVTASGGYYLACAADEIMAHPTTITGSIGVLMQTMSFKQAMNRFGVDAEAITSGPNKDAGSPLSTLTDENRAVFRAIVDDFYQQFLTVVRKSRKNIPLDQFAQLTDGRVVTGQHAVETGLVDLLGDLDTAFKQAQHMAGIQQADLIRYHRPIQYIGSPYATTPTPAVATTGAGAMNPAANMGRTTVINLAQLNISENSSRSSTVFYYLWQTP